MEEAAGTGTVEAGGEAAADAAEEVMAAGMEVGAGVEA